MNDLRQSTLSCKTGFVWDGFAPLQALGNAASTLSQARRAVWTVDWVSYLRFDLGCFQLRLGLLGQDLVIM